MRRSGLGGSASNRVWRVDPDPTWYGDSIGSRDGDTLIVDTIGFNDKFWFDFAGHPHTEDLNITERCQRPDLGRRQSQITIVDPKALYQAPDHQQSLQPGYEPGDPRIDLQRVQLGR